jgi:putative peptidoglycan lipid II flippase
VNVGALTWFSRRAGFLNIQPSLRRAVIPIVLAALAAGLGAWAGVKLLGGADLGHVLHIHRLSTPAWRDLFSLAAAGMTGAAAYGLVVLVFRRRLPITR